MAVLLELVSSVYYIGGELGIPKRLIHLFSLFYDLAYINIILEQNFE